MTVFLLLVLALLGSPRPGQGDIPEPAPECSGLDPPRETAARRDAAEETGSSPAVSLRLCRVRGACLAPEEVARCPRGLGSCV